MIEWKTLANRAKGNRALTARCCSPTQRVLCFRQSDFSVSTE